MRIAAHAGLYDPDDDSPRLRGTRCDGCGRTFFPPLAIGCEVCGAAEPALTPVALAAEGVVHSVATVHLHGGRDVEAPFTIAEIRLDDGPLVRGTLVEVAGPSVIGRRAEARWVVVGAADEGHEVVEPRFVVASP